MPRLKVLLLSPVRTLDPPNGDVTYTEELVATPPEGVDYTTYDEALADGTLREFHRSGASGGTVSLTRERVVNRLRRYRMLHREVYRYMAVKPGAYDLVHTHVFSVGWRGEPPPVLLSNAAPVDLLYRDVLGWPASRLAWARTADETLARLHGVQHTHLSPPRLSTDCMLQRDLARLVRNTPAALHGPDRVRAELRDVPSFAHSARTCRGPHRIDRRRADKQGR